MLAHLRLGHTYAQLAAGFEVGVSTVYRYITEAVGLLAVRAPDLATAVMAASAKTFVILDGTLLPIDRIAADQPFYSGKHKKHGMNVQAPTTRLNKPPLGRCAPYPPDRTWQVGGLHAVHLRAQSGRVPRAS